MKESSSELQAELEALIAWFESDDMDIDIAAEKYERGQIIVHELGKRLKNTENTITKIKAKFDT